MIVLHAEMPIDPNRREEARDLAADLVEQSNQEDGMIEYRAATDVQDPNLLRFFEQYEDEAAMEAHVESGHYQEFAAQLPDLLAGEPEVVRLDVTDATELDL